MTVLQKANYIFNTITISILVTFWMEPKTKTLKMCTGAQKAVNRPSNPKDKAQGEKYQNT